MEQKENQRIMLTKQLLQNAFLKLLKSVPLHAISIRELCKEAASTAQRFTIITAVSTICLETSVGVFWILLPNVWKARTFLTEKTCIGGAQPCWNTSLKIGNSRYS